MRRPQQPLISNAHHSTDEPAQIIKGLTPVLNCMPKECALLYTTHSSHYTHPSHCTTIYWSVSTYTTQCSPSLPDQAATGVQDCRLCRQSGQVPSHFTRSSVLRALLHFASASQSPPTSSARVQQLSEAPARSCHEPARRPDSLFMNLTLSVIPRHYQHLPSKQRTSSSCSTTTKHTSDGSVSELTSVGGAEPHCQVT